MLFYKNPEEMYKARAKRFKEDGDRHWAMAKSGNGKFHYGKAKKCYDESKRNEDKAREVKVKRW